MNEWQKLEKSADKGPTSFLIRVVFIFFTVSVVVGSLGYVAGWFTEGAQVIKEEFGPREALRKYEWFKDAAAQLEAKQADITVYEGRLTNIQEMYATAADDGGALPRHKWPRTDLENYNLWSQEVAGIKASYNALAADYNSQMAKFNWRFANQGDLPQGATDPLPREFKPYVSN